MILDYAQFEAYMAELASLRSKDPSFDATPKTYEWLSDDEVRTRLGLLTPAAPESP